MKYRFQIVASSFHKGRLKITYDPYYQVTNEYNVCYTHVIDLSQDRDFTVEMGWGQPLSMLKVATPSATARPFDTSVIGPDAAFAYNGVLSVYVVNDLAVPNVVANNDIQVNVFVSGSDDIEFFNPTDESLRNLTWYAPQMGEVYSPQSGMIDDHEEGESMPMSQNNIDIMAAPLSFNDKTSLVFFGDPVVSFRQCLKRYVYHRFRAKPLIGYTLTNMRVNDFPDYRGPAPSAIDLTGTISAYNYAKMTLLNYLTPAYVCRRGAIRWKYIREGDDETSQGRLFQANRTNFKGYLLTEEDAEFQTSGPSVAAAQLQRFIPHTWVGATATTKAQNPVLEIELPWYSSERFFPGKAGDMATATRLSSYHTVTAIMSTPSNGAALAGFHAYNSVGEDFNLAFFTGAPILYYLAATDDPTPYFV